MRSILLLVLLFNLGTQQTNDKSPQKSETSKPRNQSNTKEHSLPPVAAPPTVVPHTTDCIGSSSAGPEKNSDENKGENSEQNKHDWITYLNAASTSLMAIFTILIWRIYKAMLHASNTTDRAWIVPDVGPIEKTPIPNTFQITIHFINNGKTPAWILEAGSNGMWTTSVNPLPKKPNYILMGPLPPKGQLLPPTAYLPQGFPIDQGRIQLVLRGQMDLYIYGYTRYLDVFGKSHLTRYCYKAKKPQDANHPFPLEFFFDNPTNDDAYLDAN